MHCVVDLSIWSLFIISIFAFEPVCIHIYSLELLIPIVYIELTQIICIINYSLFTPKNRLLDTVLPPGPFMHRQHCCQPRLPTENRLAGWLSLTDLSTFDWMEEMTRLWPMGYTESKREWEKETEKRGERKKEKEGIFFPSRSWFVFSALGGNETTPTCLLWPAVIWVNWCLVPVLTAWGVQGILQFKRRWITTCDMILPSA